MNITIHNIKVKDGKEHITFTSERNEKGLTVAFSRSSDNNQRLKRLDKYIENNLFEPSEVKLGEFNTETDIIEEEKEEEELKEEVEETEEERLQREYRSEKQEVDEKISILIKGLKEDNELLLLKDAFNYTSDEIQAIMDKKKTKFVEYETLKTRLEELKELIVEDEDELV